MLKVVSWNVNSIRKGVKDELIKLINDHYPDIICLQETKCSKEDGEAYLENNCQEIIENYPYRFWNSSVKGQAGVACFSKIEPLEVKYEIPLIFQLKHGRVIVLTFENLIILNTYVPNTGRGQEAEQFRNVWHNGMVSWLEANSDKFLLWCGDLNVVDDPKKDTSHHIIRPKHPPAGLKEFEHRHFKEYIELGLIDVFRHFNPDEVSFTWYSNLNQQIGWRLDYFLVNDISRVKNIIHHSKMPKSVSDHVWILCELNWS